MLDTVLTRLRVKVISVISSATTLIHRLLYRLIGALTEIKTRSVGSLISLLHLLVQIELRFKALLAQLTSLVLSIKAALITAKQTLIQIGSLLLTTVRQILQPVATAIKKSKGLVVKIKSALSHISVSKIAQLPIVRQLIQGGLRFVDLANRLLQRVLSQVFKGR